MYYFFLSGEEKKFSDTFIKGEVFGKGTTGEIFPPLSL